jgi:hypothetical protein
MFHLVVFFGALRELDKQQQDCGKRTSLFEKKQD